MIPLRYFFSAFAALLIFSSVVFAQIPDDQDTVMVPYDYVNNNGDITGSLNQFIADDLADGGIPAGRVYKLQRGQYYLLSGLITIDGYDLRLYGEPGPAETPPAVVAGGFKADGSGFWQYFKMASGNDVEFKNIYFMGSTPTDKLTGELIRFVSDGSKIVADNCVFDSFHFITIHFFKTSYNSAYITNCYFRNLNNKNGGKYNGRALRMHQSTHVDTIIMVNNTYVNSNSFFLDLNRFEIADYVKVDHNTIINTVKFVFQWHWQTNAWFTNNLFYNGHSYGETVADAANQDPDGLVFGIFGIDTIGVDSLGIEEADRNVILTNNAWYYDSKVQNYWDARDSVMSEPFLNSRSQAMFDDDATWPGLIEENNLNYGPQFTKFPTYSDGHVVTDDMVTYMCDQRDGTSNGTNNWGFYPEGTVFFTPAHWPLKNIEDFSYGTSDPLYTAGTGGFPIGDLNWFPDKKAEWEEWVNDVELDDAAGVPSSFELSQNYPNPFNPTTVINFNLPEKSLVTLKVYNILGQEIATLVNDVKDAGAYHVQFNADNLPSGVYIYALSAGDFTATKKMMLLK